MTGWANGEPFRQWADGAWYFGTPKMDPAITSQLTYTATMATGAMLINSFNLQVNGPNLDKNLHHPPMGRRQGPGMHAGAAEPGLHAQLPAQSSALADFESLAPFCATP